MSYKIERSNEEINSTGGIYLVGGLLNRSKLFADSVFSDGGGRLNYAGHLKTMIALICCGRTDFNDVELYRDDIVCRESLGLSWVPSEATLRQRLNEAAMLGLHELLPNENLSLFENIARFGCLKADGMEFTPIHCDVTPMDNSGTKKEKVGRTYKGFDGYAPIMAYLGTEGYLLNCELRPGRQHCQNGTPAFLRETISLEERLRVENPLYIMDSGNDSAENIDIFLENDKYFIVKRNPRREHPARLLSQALTCGNSFSPRPGKTVYTGTLAGARPEGLKSTRPLFLHYKIVERTIDGKGEPLLIPSHEIDSWWSNIPNYTDTLVDFYHTQGTSEQYHSEYKSELDLERLPSESFETNSLIFRLGMISFNVLRCLGQSMLELTSDLPVKLEIHRRRIGSVMKDLIYIACKRVEHANRVILKFGRNCPWFTVFKKLSLKFC